MDDKSHSKQLLRVTPQQCRDAVKSHQSPYGPLHRSSALLFTTLSNFRYTCRWMQTKTVTYSHFTLNIFSATITRHDSNIHQLITKSSCQYLNLFCIPQEKPTTILVWNQTVHTPEVFHTIGKYQVHHIGQYILIPVLKMGGASLITLLVQSPLHLN